MYTLDHLRDISKAREWHGSVVLLIAVVVIVAVMVCRYYYVNVTCS